ncbi:uncharacterized protein M421DRAFT_62702 [Didymella exigua CBS 183.55]|uniref:Zn(2)-C6 fungal-type domain-containing protein n=1 Tax=Didymella exigua CBS 183.55 TaxID=1150837 RepID=A0A6A5RL50_9PLEO|nr:uncharacterized protein M421DRAFT_62702 [Didymella exigua CBS 183.55]KAF1928522.1 hypothetical protein M421DRAFT_62702 [Didymella exigua CBS 183.55]
MNVARRQTQRQRQRIACDPCRERKRKCDGSRPCNMCLGYGYECVYRSAPRSRRSQRVTSRSVTVATQEGSPSISAQTPSRLLERQHQHEMLPDRHQDDIEQSLERLVEEPRRQIEQGPPCYLRSVESNSGAAFVRLLTVSLNSSSSSVSPIRMLGWNLFLGERQAVLSTHAELLSNVLSEVDMQHLADIYLEKFHPCYGFVDKESLLRSISNTWNGRSRSDAKDAMLSGVAAIACLFSNSQDSATEQTLVALAKRLLDPSITGAPSKHLAIAWLLRTVYLRLTAKPEEAWMASCNTLHVIDATISINRIGTSSLPVSIHEPQDVPDIQTNLCGVAQHLNIWLSYDLGRSRVVLPTLDAFPLFEKPGEYTAELLGLLPYSEVLDPTNKLSSESLLATLVEVLRRDHTEPPSVLAQCNLTLCIYRRIHSAKSDVPDRVMHNVFNMMQKSIRAVHSAIARGLPWHHVANIPFQLLCMLLAMDTPQSFGLLGEALSCIIAVNEGYPTEATREAVTAARTFLQLHRKRRETEVQNHTNMLSLYPFVDTELPQNQDALLDADVLQESWWFNEFMAHPDMLGSGIDFGLQL